MRVEGFRVRVAEAADVVGVVALERGIAEAPHWAEAEYAAMVDADKADSAVRRCFFVGEAEGRLLGFAVGKVIGSNGEGVGELESVGVRALELEVRAGSAGAIALYSGVGFVVAGRRAGYYREPVEDAVLMRLDLEKDQ